MRRRPAGPARAVRTPGDPGTGGGPQACTVQADCATACPQFALGCTCATTPQGSQCIPNCKVDADCPAGGPMTLTCDANSGTCVPAGGPGGTQP